ncbi:MAG: phosphate starvation-inducible protein PsiF [Proteobacteria bacterium]|nr:phosphate starvation-inducible protein PsiF [Pseudomonadota bacterium]
MRRSMWLAALGAALVLGISQAPLAQADNSQQTKMGTCNTDATSQGLKGDDRKAYMKKCLSAAKTNSQQEKMKSCNADATTKGLKGDDRKTYMKTCLSGGGAAH